MFNSFQIKITFIYLLSFGYLVTFGESKIKQVSSKSKSLQNSSILTMGLGILKISKI